MKSKLQQLVLSALTLAVLVGISPEASAWHWAFPFAGGPWHGAAGNYYTGSPRSNGVNCGSCHTGQSRFQNRVSMQVTTRRVQGGSLVNDDIFANGYQPGARYKISVSLVGEHQGFEPTNGQYQDANGTAHKVACPLSPVDNVNILTAEVMDESNTYANYSGNSAGRLRADRTNNPNDLNEANRCLVATAGCGGGTQDYPQRTLQGGPTTVSYSSLRLTNPNGSPPFGSYTCVECDAIVSMYGADVTPTTAGGFPQRVDHFFWTAPNSPPSGNGRIRFYMAFMDGDGYTDIYDDDFAEFRRAICPAGNAACNPTNPPWNFTSVVPAAPTNLSPRQPAPPNFMLGIAATAMALIAMMAMAQLRARRGLMMGATAALLLGVALFATGCVNVKAWERGRMATLCMSRGPDVEEAMIERTFLESREGSSGGSAAAAGGGCACN